MTVGDKIKKIRTFPGKTQKELGVAIGFDEMGADNRIAQYKTNYRVPKTKLLDKIAEALNVDRQNFYSIASGCAEDFMRSFFWLNEDTPGAIRLFQFVRNPGKTEASDDTVVRYNANDDWLAHAPWGFTFSTVLWTSSCGSGYSASRNFTPGRSPGINTLNGNLTGRSPATIVESVSLLLMA